MKWFKMYSEARNDAKLRTLTDSEFRAWFNLLCMAAEQKVRGCIEGRSFRIIAIEVGGDCSSLRGLLDKLVGMEMVELSGGNTDDDKCEIVFRKFSDRQNDFPSNSPEAVAKRVKRYRNKSSNVTTCNDNVTSCNDSETTSNDKKGDCNEDVTTQRREDKSREEEIREDNKQPMRVAPRRAEHLNIESPLAMEIRKVCQKKTLILADKDRTDLVKVLDALHLEGATPEQVREFGEVWPAHWKGERGEPPSIPQVLQFWGERETLAAKIKNGMVKNGKSNTGHTTATAALAARRAAEAASRDG